MNFNELPRVGVRRHIHDVEHPRYTSLWVGIGAAVLGAGTAVYTSDQQRKLQHQALDAQRGIGANINYEPIDIEKLKIDAQNQAIANATASLAIERGLQPDVSATREELARQIRTGLAEGGKLPADVQNQVTLAGRTIGARSGVGVGGTTPLTASLIGLKSIDLMHQRQQAAADLLRMNDLPTGGLDPGALASIEVANNAANNQFNLEKAGVASNLASGEAAARASQIGSTAGIASSLAGLVGQVKSSSDAYQASRAGVGPKTTYDDFVKRYGQTAPYVPVDTSFSFS